MARSSYSLTFKSVVFVCLGLLFVIGLVGIDFFCPYRFDQQFEALTYQAPVLWSKTSESCQWFVRGYEYKVLGISCDWHLWGSSSDQSIFLLGSDQFGRDIFSRLVWASRISLGVACAGVAVTFVLGMGLGGVAGYWGGCVDRLLMRVCELLMSFPFFFVMLALRGVFPSSMSSVQTYVCIVILMSLVAWPGLARVIRGMVLSLKEREFVVAMRCAGMKQSSIIRKYVLPHTYSYAIVAALLNIPVYILAEAGLSFFGLGIQEPYPSWGNMLQAAMNVTVLQMYPWMLFPGAALFVVVFVVLALGDCRVTKEQR